MGAVCPGGLASARNRFDIHHDRNCLCPKKPKAKKNFGKENRGNCFCSENSDLSASEKMQNLFDSGELQFSGEMKPTNSIRSGANKAAQASAFLGKASIAGLEKAVEVIEHLGCSVTNLNNSGFLSAMGSKGSGISILSFEVANTITKAVNLLQSLSEESVRYLKDEILCSKSVQELVSTDMNELLVIAAADKREEFKVFSQEVIRFGNMCKDPQWHNLERYFSTLDSNPVSQEQLKEEVKTTMHELVTLAQHTSELYHELHTLDRFEQDYRKKAEEMDTSNLPRKWESLMMFQSDIKHQAKIVKGLKKKSLWSKSLEEVVEKLVDIVLLIHQEISEAFRDIELTYVDKEPMNRQERLGAAGLALHYANLIIKIDNIASRPTSLPSNVRDSLYNALPPSVKTTLRSRLQALHKEELTAAQIKAEMEKTLEWLLPVATDTAKAYQGFGWIGEWANNGNDLGNKSGTQCSLIQLQTLYHADKTKMDSHIIELVTFLHRLVTVVKHNGPRSQPEGSITHNRQPLLTKKPNTAQHSLEDLCLLEEVENRRKFVPMRSKSQNFAVPDRVRNQVMARSRSFGCSPNSILEHPKSNVANALDILDGIASQF